MMKEPVKVMMQFQKTGIIIPHPGIMGGDDLLESVSRMGKTQWSKIDIVRMKIISNYSWNFFLFLWL